MLNKFKQLINSLIQKSVYNYRYSSDSFINFLRKKGVSIGERVTFFQPTTTIVDFQNPHLLKLGNDIQITSGVTILTHDYAWSVIKRKYGEVLGGTGEVTIGDNCFIGVNSTILCNTHIGNNVIIGANSTVCGDIPSNSVVAGSPAKVIMSLDDYYNKRKQHQIKDAKMHLDCYRNRYGKEPDIDVFNEYFWLFTNDLNSLTQKCKNQMKNCGNEEESNQIFLRHTPQYNGFENMINELSDTF